MLSGERSGHPKEYQLANESGTGWAQHSGWPMAAWMARQWVSPLEFPLDSVSATMLVRMSDHGRAPELDGVTERVLVEQLVLLMVIQTGL